MKTSLQFKMALMFFIVMLVSASISVSLLLFIFSPIIRDTSEQQLKSVVSSMHELEKLDKYSTAEIITLCTNTAYSVTNVSSECEDVTLRLNEIEKSGVSVKKSRFMPDVTAFTTVNGEYLKIGSFARENIFWVVNFVVIVAFIMCIILGTIITAFISRTILQPIRDLNKATSEVAKGNFSVRVKEPLDVEYASLTRNFNYMAEQLSDIETLRGDFISNVSHEFKTPLASIQGFAKLLQDDAVATSDDARREYTQIIIDETTRLSNLASNILRLSKLENQTTIGKKTRFSIDEQIRKIILMLEPSWSKKNINLDIELESLYYYGNEDLMGQIWQNIIANAIKFTFENGTISVKLFKSEKNIKVIISDSGIGISDDIKIKIFDKFYQGDHSRKTEGNGLGLALVKRIMDLYNGNIKVENSSLGGTSFIVELPYIAEDMGDIR